MKIYSNIFLHQVEQTILEINQKNLDQENKLKNTYIALEQHVAEMNKWLRTYVFSSEKEEIYFFKHVKPQIIANLFYYKTRLKWESKTFLEPSHEKESYLKKYHKIEHKIKDLSYIDEYQKMGNTHNDTVYFIRRHNLSAVAVYTEEYINYDSLLATPQCLAISKLLSYKMLITYLKSKFQNGNKESIASFKKLYWNSSKQNMYELIYALYYADVVGNEGKTPLSKIAEAFEFVFDVELKEHLYKRWVNQKGKKKDSTPFLNKITLELENKIESCKNE